LAEFAGTNVSPDQQHVSWSRLLIHLASCASVFTNNLSIFVVVVIVVMDVVTVGVASAFVVVSFVILIVEQQPVCHYVFEI
jgi:hypothetical protein